MNTSLNQYTKALIFDEDNNMLLLRRSKTAKARPLEVDLAGGTVESDETVEEALHREIFEEVGIDSRSLKPRLIYTETNFYDGHNTICYLYALNCKSVPEITLSFEHDEFEWVNTDEGIKRLNHPVWGKGLQHAQTNGLI